VLVTTERNLDLIRAERARQITAKGYTPEHDADHGFGELARAGAAYALYAGGAADVVQTGSWPWPDWPIKPSRQLGHDGVIERLAKAGALIVAEMDRLSPGGPPGEIERLETEIATLARRMTAAEEALTAERFRDVPRYAEHDLVLVPRKLFGKTRLWPARIARVHLTYGAGVAPSGEPWEHKTVTYSVYLKQRDGSFGGTSEGYHHADIWPRDRPVPPGMSAENWPARYSDAFDPADGAP
jgi:hypothetical protein